MTGGTERPEPTSPEPTSTVIRVVALAAVAAVSGVALLASITGSAAAGGGAPDKTIPGTPTTTTTTTTTTTEPTESTAAPATTEPPASTDVPSTSDVVVVDTGIALPANADLAPMFAVARPLIGPTNDVATALSSFAVMPDGIPSPVDSTIQDFSVHYYGREGYYSAEATFTTTATPDDVIVFYETAMTDAGFVLTTDSAQSGSETHALEFDTPGSDYTGASVRVAIETGDEPVITLTVLDAVDADTLAAFGGWARGMPTVGDGVPIEATLSAVSDPDFVLTVSTRFLYADRTADELEQEVRDALADGSGGFRLDPELDDGSSTITMTHSVILSPSAEISADDDGAAMLLVGSLQI